MQERPKFPSPEIRQSVIFDAFWNWSIMCLDSCVLCSRMYSRQVCSRSNGTTNAYWVFDAVIGGVQTKLTVLHSLNGDYYIF